MPEQKITNTLFLTAGALQVLRSENNLEFLVVPQRTSILSLPSRPPKLWIIANIRELIRGWLRISGLSNAPILH